MELRKHVVVIGAGGNIGSHLVPHLARMPEIGRLTLVDRGVYEHRNLLNQDVPPSSPGRKKAAVQAARARSINPPMDVAAIAEDVESVPLGALRGDLILACLDSRRARQRVNQAAGRLDVPWIDSGVLGEGLLGRVTRYVPGPELPCLECRWDESDYAAIEQSYPCAGGGTEAAPAPTTAPSSLGALVAALQAIECRKLLTEKGTPLPPGSELVVDAAHHRHYVTAARRNPHCRRSDHGPWAIEPLADGCAAELGSLLESARQRVGGGGNGDLGLRVEGKRFIRELSCEECGAKKRLLRLTGSLRPSDLRCRLCGGRVVPNGFGLTERLEAGALSRAERNRQIAALGIRVGEVVSVGTAEHELHLEIVER